MILREALNKLQLNSKLPTHTNQKSTTLNSMLFLFKKRKKTNTHLIRTIFQSWK